MPGWKQWKERHPDRNRLSNARYRDTDAFRKLCADYKREYRRNNPHEVARDATKVALRSGRLVRPDHCVKCGLVCKPEAHHPDYDKPLEVVWLCRVCHLEETNETNLSRGI